LSCYFTLVCEFTAECSLSCFVKVFSSSCQCFVLLYGINLRIVYIMDFEALSSNFRDVMLELRVRPGEARHILFFPGQSPEFQGLVTEYVSAMMDDKRMRLIVIPTPLGSCSRAQATPASCPSERLFTARYESSWTSQSSSFTSAAPYPLNASINQSGSDSCAEAC